MGRNACACALSPEVVACITLLKSRSAASMGDMLEISGAIPPAAMPEAGAGCSTGPLVDGTNPGPGRTIDNPTNKISANIATPVIHHGKFCPLTTASRAASRRPGAPAPAVGPPGATSTPHSSQNFELGEILTPHWLQKRPPRPTPQCRQKLPEANRPHSEHVVGPEETVIYRIALKSSGHVAIVCAR